MVQSWFTTKELPSSLEHIKSHSNKSCDIASLPNIFELALVGQPQQQLHRVHRSRDDWAGVCLPLRLGVPYGSHLQRLLLGASVGQCHATAYKTQRKQQARNVSATSQMAEGFLLDEYRTGARMIKTDHSCPFFAQSEGSW